MQGSRTQRITAKDIAGGRIRIPRQTKRLLPHERARIQVDLLGHRLDCRWDPKYGLDQERSGVIGVRRGLLARLVEPDEVLFLSAASDGVALTRGAGQQLPSASRRLPMRSHRGSGVDSQSVPVRGDAARWRRTREEAAAKYRPEHVRLLLVAEAPPSSLDRYFYFPEVRTQDSLFRYVVRLLLGSDPDRPEKRRDLAALQEAGVCLIDLCLDPITKANDLKECVPNLVHRAARLKPQHVILVKTRVFDAAFRAMREAGLPVLDARVPLPGSGQQRRFEVEMRAALDAIGWTSPGSQQ